MYCQNCGKENDKEAKYCEECGSNLKQRKKHKAISKTKKIVIGIIIIIIVAAIVLYFVLSNIYSPSKIAENYFLALMNNDLDKLYNYIDVDSNEFTTKEIFKDVTEKEDIDPITNYTVSSYDVSDDGLTAKVVINYTTDDNKTDSLTVNLVNEGTKYLLFNEWTISSNSQTKNDVEIVTYKDSNVKIEGITLDNDYLTESTDDYDIYTISEMFIGNYEVEETLENGIILGGDITISSYGNVDLTNLGINENDKKTLEKELNFIVEDLYQSAIDGKSFSDIKDSYNYGDADLNDLKSAYNDFMETINSGSLTDYKVDNLEITNSKINNNKLVVTTKTEYEYTLNYKVLGEEKIKTSNGEDVMYFTFEYVDGYKLNNISSMTTYFSKL